VDRDPEEAEQLAEELRSAAEGGATVEAAGPGAELHGEVVIIAVYYPGNLEIARDLGDRLTGKVVVDISNPLNQTFDGLATRRAPRQRRRWQRPHRPEPGSSRPSTPPSPVR
jgi:predicted dinucleotide-binding enzyme